MSKACAPINEPLLTELGFEVEKVGHMKTEDFLYTRLYHKKSGGRVTLCHREDGYKTFSIVFRTSPSSDNGVFHILEHSVLCGSRRFPVKDPFTEVMKGSLNVYMNAFTGSDRTYYPFSTPSEKDFFNLAEVYLDSVFHPLAIENEHIFMQEGHRIEKKAGAVGDDPHDPALYTRTGVVYNEMEGAYSSVDDFADYRISKMMYPGGTYAYDSGGHPDCVEELTFAEFSETYHRFYHPENCMVYADGGVDCERLLRLISGYFDEYIATGHPEGLSLGTAPILYDYRSADARVEREYYPAAEGDDTTRLCLGWRGAPFGDRAEHNAMTVAFSTICDSNSSRLKKAMMDSGICEDMSLTHMSDGIDGVSYAELDGVDPDKAEQAVVLLTEELRRIVEEGIDRESLTATLKQVEFVTRMSDSGTTPRGIVNLRKFNNCFIYGAEPEDMGDMDALFEPLYAMLDNGGYERVIKRRILDTLPTALLCVPDSRRAVQRRREAEERLAAALPKTDEGWRQLEKANRSFTLWQRQQDSDEAIASIPRLTLSDVGEPAPLTDTAGGVIGGVPVIHHRIRTGGVCHVEIYFDLSDLDTESLYLAGLFSVLRGEMPTASGSAAHFRNKIRMKIGSLSVNTVCLKQGDEPRLYLCLRASALEKDGKNLPEIIKEALYTLDFTDTEALSMRLDQYLLALTQSIDEWAQDAITVRALGMFDRTEALKDRVLYLSSGEKVKHLMGASPEELLPIAEGLERIKPMLTPDRALIAVTRDEFDTGLVLSLIDAICAGAELVSKAQPSMSEWVKNPITPDEVRMVKGAEDISSLLIDRAKRIPCPVGLFKKESVGLATTSDTAYAQLVSNFKTETDCSEHRGSFLAYNNIMNLGPLWELIRVRGGAYGAGLSTKANTGGIVVHSYRDPSPDRSLKIFAATCTLMEELLSRLDSPEKNGDAEAQNNPLADYLISTVGSTDSPMSPRAESYAATNRILCLLGGGELLRRRAQILATDPTELRSVGRIYAQALSRGVVAVAAPEERLRTLNLDRIIIP